MSSSNASSPLLEAFIKRSRSIVLAGAVLILALSWGLLQYALSDKTPRSLGSPLPTSPSSAAGEVAGSSSTPFLPRFLDGVDVSPTGTNLQVYGVMVENSPEARPLSGPARANVVLESPVEGGITRFLLLFDAQSTVDQIGPVRSARPYFVDWAEAVQAVYAHVGGSPEALQRITASANIRNLDEFFLARYFWRSSKRSAPHNTYTRMDLLRSSQAAKQGVTSVFKPWSYAASEAASSTPETAVSSVSIPYGGPFNVTWVYDSLQKTYMRRQADQLELDADGMVVTATNVVVMATDMRAVDQVGRLHVRTTGTGKAWVYRNGQRFEGVWSRQPGQWLSFEQSDGRPISFAPGKTWISVIAASSMTPMEVLSTHSSEKTL